MDIDTLKDLIKQAHRPEKNVPVCLRGDLRASWEDLEQQLAGLHKRPRTSLADPGSDGEAAAIVEQMKAIEDEMREATVSVRLRALERDGYRALLKEHPPREDEPADGAMGVNSDTFYQPLILKCWIEPAELDEAGRKELLQLLTQAQYDSLATAAVQVNRGTVDVPFSRAASRMTPNSDGTSKRPPD
jgi:hypothetical protein